VTGARVTDSVAAATLASLQGATPYRLHRMFVYFGSPARALDAVRAGHAAKAIADDRQRAALARRWQHTADPVPIAALLEQRGTRVWAARQPGFPFDADLPSAAAVLFAEGDREEVLDRPRVAIVGTRASTPPGNADARAIGRYLGEQGITIVSGLALGIDAAAHQGALEVGGGVIGVVATGLDIVYPAQHHLLYTEVRKHGLVLSENAFGVPPTRARFPVRNRIIAALCDAVVVVEATAKGGARITARWAAKYNREVLAVPGSRRNSAAVGCNELIADGALSLLDPSDVLMALGRHSPATGARPVGWGGREAKISAAARRLHAVMAGEPATLDELVARSGMAVGTVAGLIRELERAGRLERARGVLWPC
jgi:DNA processing protein